MNSEYNFCKEKHKNKAVKIGTKYEAIDKDKRPMELLNFAL